MPRQFHRPARLDPEAAESLLVTEDTAVASQLAHHTAQFLLAASAGSCDGAGAGLPDGTATDRRDSTDGPGVLGSRGEAATELLTRERVLDVVARHGVDDVAEMWASSPATTLPGALWRLFLVREWVRRDPELVERRYATVVDLTRAGTSTEDGGQQRVQEAGQASTARRAAEAADAQARLEAALADARPVPSPQEVGARIELVLTGRLSPADLAPLLDEVAWFLRALAAGSHPEWIEQDTDALAVPVTRRSSALLETAEELSQAARRAAAGRLD